MLPLMETDSWLRGRRAVALPFTDECSPLGADRETFGRLFATAVEFGKSRGWKSIECRGGRKFFEAGVPASLSFYGHGLDLTVGEGTCCSATWMAPCVGPSARPKKQACGSNFRKAWKPCEIFYGLQCQTRKRHGLPPQPFQFFVNIQRHILSENLGTIAIARHGGKNLAAAVYFFLGGRAIYNYGASDDSQQHLRGPSLVMWEAMKWLAARGAKSLHLGKTSPANEGLRRFKLHLGAREEVIDYVKFDLRQDRFVTDTDAINGWHNRIFRVMPTVFARAAGRMLYNHWA